MSKINENFLKLQNNYLFSEIQKKTEKYIAKNLDKNIINLGVGNVTLPLSKVVVDAMKKACDEMQKEESFRGYGSSVL